uniref:Uncharacterized protein n=1 Tax=Cacopsylla melanoneura TaxID=428564 RepID=A0A8D8PM79_9HEMI
MRLLVMPQYPHKLRSRPHHKYLTHFLFAYFLNISIPVTPPCTTFVPTFRKLLPRGGSVSLIIILHLKSSTSRYVVCTLYLLSLFLQNCVFFRKLIKYGRTFMNAPHQPR